MKQNRQMIFLAVLVVVLAIGGPSWLARKQAAGLDLKTKATDEQVKALKSKTDQAKIVKKNKANYTAALDKARAAMPSDNDVKGAIRSLQSLAIASGLEWVGYSSSNIVDASVKGTVKDKAPAPTKEEAAALAKAAKSAGPTTTVAAGVSAPQTFTIGGFDLSINVKGTRTDVLGYLEKIRSLPSPSRLFVVTSVALDLKRGIGAADASGDRSLEAQISVHATGFAGSQPVNAEKANAGSTPTTTVAAGATPKPVAPAQTTTAVAAAAPAPAAVKSTTTVASAPASDTTSTTSSSA
jgi:hypothetical protein